MLTPRDRDRQRLACGRSDLNDVGAVTLRPVDHDPVLAGHRHFFLLHSSSASRFTAGAFAFFILSQSGERPERVTESLRFENDAFEAKLAGALSAQKQNEQQGQQERKGHERGNLVCR